MSPTLTDAAPLAAVAADGLSILESRKSAAETFGIPLAVLAELTHRCPLQCPYCSNPVELERAGSELTTDEWKKVLSELAEIGVLQIHFSGGEPTARKDIVELVQHANDVGLYTNLITSAVLLSRDKLKALADAGLCHVQISFQGNEPVIADRVAGLKDAHRRKIEVARRTREFDLPLTVNAVMHRQNLHQLADIIQMAVDLDADRLEVANVQYYGWALKNRAALMPTLQQIEETSRIVEDAQERLKGILTIDYVVPDYYALRPKKCMGGWGRQFFNISPSGKILPCHAAETITGLDFLSVRSNHSIAWIWQNSEAFNRYRGTGWMPEPCQSCEFKEVDFGGCRCQAFALTGDAGNTDPACTLSPLHERIFKTAEAEASGGSDRFIYRNFAGGTPEAGAAMPPDAEARPSTRADPNALLTSQHLDVGDGHEIYVETVGRAGGIPAVYLHGGPGSGCQPDHRRLFDPERFHAVLFDQRGAGRSRPKGGREANTLPHLIADMEKIRETLGFMRWMIVGGSWGATLALAYAEAHPDRVSGIVLRATFLGTRTELETAFLSTLPRIYPGLYDDFLSLLPDEEKAQPLDAYWRRILDPNADIHGPAARAWYETERTLSEHTPGRTRINLEAIRDSRQPLPSTPFMEAHYFQNDCFMRPDQLMADIGKLRDIPGIIIQGRTDFLCPPSTSHALAAAWPDADIRIVEGAGHSLYDPGIKDAIMLAIENLASKIAT